MIRTYTELKRIRSFNERYQYLMLSASVGAATFGYDRYLNQALYTSRRWLKTRDEIIIRDEGRDLGVSDFEIFGRIVIHHMNPVSIDDVELDRDILYDPEFLICTSLETHNAIHYGNTKLLKPLPIVRSKHDTCPWNY